MCGVQGFHVSAHPFAVHMMSHLPYSSSVSVICIYLCLHAIISDFLSTCVFPHNITCKITSGNLNSLLTVSAVKILVVLRFTAWPSIDLLFSDFCLFVTPLKDHPHPGPSLSYQGLSAILLACSDKENNQTEVTEGKVLFLECCHYHVFYGVVVSI